MIAPKKGSLIRMTPPGHDGVTVLCSDHGVGHFYKILSRPVSLERNTANLELTERFGIGTTLPDRKKQAIELVGCAYSDASNDLALNRPRLSRR